MIQKLINKLPKRFQWAPHNLLAHPIMELLHQLGFHNLSEKIHNITIPEEEVYESSELE